MDGMNSSKLQYGCYAARKANIPRKPVLRRTFLWRSVVAYFDMKAKQVLVGFRHGVDTDGSISELESPPTMAMASSRFCCCNS